MCTSTISHSHLNPPWEGDNSEVDPTCSAQDGDVGQMGG